MKDLTDEGKDIFDKDVLEKSKHHALNLNHNWYPD